MGQSIKYVGIFWSFLTPLPHIETYQIFNDPSRRKLAIYHFITYTVNNYMEIIGTLLVIPMLCIGIIPIVRYKV